MPNICPFCTKNPATKSNSHIVSNFLTESMKTTGNASKVFMISKFIASGKYKFNQDSSKENNIFCPGCETLFNENFERSIANTFYKDYIQKTNFFNVALKSKNVSYRVFTNIDYVIFKKFLLLQLYRAHISNLPEFGLVSLSKAHLSIVYDNLTANNFQDVSVTIFTTDQVIDKTENVICAFPVGKDSYFFWMNEFICVFDFNENDLAIPQTKEGSNFNVTTPRLMYLDLNGWKQFQAIVIHLLGMQA